MVIVKLSNFAYKAIKNKMASDLAKIGMRKMPLLQCWAKKFKITILNLLI